MDKPAAGDRRKTTLGKRGAIDEKHPRCYQNALRMDGDDDEEEGILDQDVATADICQKLERMGFTNQQAMKAFRRGQCYTVEDAVDWLLSIEEADDDEQEGEEKSEEQVFVVVDDDDKEEQNDSHHVFKSSSLSPQRRQSVGGKETMLQSSPATTQQPSTTMTSPANEMMSSPMLPAGDEEEEGGNNALPGPSHHPSKKRHKHEKKEMTMMKNEMVDLSQEVEEEMGDVKHATIMAGDDDLRQALELMGIAKEQAVAALAHCTEKTLDACLQWLFDETHDDE